MILTRPSPLSFPLKLWHPATTDSLMRRSASEVRSNFLKLCLYLFKNKEMIHTLSHRFWVKLNEKPRWWALKLQRNSFWCWLDKFYSKGGELHHISENKCFPLSISMLCYLWFIVKKSIINIFTKTFEGVLYSSFSDIG